MFVKIVTGIFAHNVLSENFCNVLKMYMHTCMCFQVMRFQKWSFRVNCTIKKSKEELPAFFAQLKDVLYTRLLVVIYIWMYKLLNMLCIIL